ncbi:MAG: YjgN family protein [Flexibacteraceae bacterium]
MFPTDPNEELPEYPEHLNESDKGNDSADDIQESANEDTSEIIDSNTEGKESIDNQVSDAAVDEEESAVLATETNKSEPEEINDSEEFGLASDILDESTIASTQKLLVRKRYLLEFEGRGNDYFFIAFRGYVLTVLTLGLYYPWARVQRTRYILNNLWLDGSPFVFEATGEEVFRGFIKVYAILAVLGGLYLYALLTEVFWLISLMPTIFTLFGLIITPLAIHGSLRFRASKTSWKGIYFNYSGDLTEIYNLFANNLVRLLVTLGLYNSWARVKVYRYIVGNMSLGNIEFKYKGAGSEIFIRAIVNTVVVYGAITVISLANTFLVVFPNFETFKNPTSGNMEDIAKWLFIPILIVCIFGITYGILNFKVWVMRYNLRVTKFRLGRMIGKIDEKLNISNIALFETVNFLILVVTLGVGTPFVAIRRMQKYTQLISFLAPFDFDNVIQTGKEYNDAFGEDLGDQFDIQLDLM